MSTVAIMTQSWQITVSLVALLVSAIVTFWLVHDDGCMDRITIADRIILACR